MMPLDDSLSGRSFERFRALPPGERRAIAACLEPAERAQLRGVLTRLPRRGAAWPYAEDIVARITAPASDGAMTDAGRRALARVVEQRHPAPQPAAASLAGRLCEWLGRLR